ncbi:MAG: hypothetical protein HZB76_01840 [Chlamydiae bacterium]|nr:hypothetical protein [Chlamydiota bacterium]
MNKIIICDTSVLINFLNIKRVDLFEKSINSFIITDHVYEEITINYPDQLTLLNMALNQKILQKVSINEPKVYEIFEEVIKSARLGSGECSAIAFASNYGYYLAIDDKRATKKASIFLSSLKILRTQDLIVAMIKEHLLEIEEADNLILIWAKDFRFKLKIHSFRELIPNEIKDEIIP